MIFKVYKYANQIEQKNLFVLFLKFSIANHKFKILKSKSSLTIIKMNKTKQKKK